MYLAQAAALVDLLMVDQEELEEELVKFLGQVQETMMGNQLMEAQQAVEAVEAVEELMQQVELLEAAVVP
jgi:predicted RecB family endonuclease